MKKNIFLDLGNQPFANNYLNKKDKLKKEKKYRLKVCFNNITKLVSIEKVFSSKQMFKYDQRWCKSFVLVIT